VITPEGKKKKRVIKRRKIITREDGKEKTTDIVTIEDEGKQPETTVSVKEVEIPEEEIIELPKRKPKKKLKLRNFLKKRK